MIRIIKRYFLYYIPLLVGLCVVIFPFVILYTTSLGIGHFLDAVFPSKRYGKKLDNMWNILGKPYDYMVSKL